MKKNNSSGSLKLFVKNLVLFVFVVITALVVVPVVLVWLAADFLAFSIYDFKFLGLIVGVVGASFLLNMFVYFALAGRGTPAPFDPPKRLVTNGLFRYVRNPGYIGGVLVIVGEGIFFESTVVFIYATFMWVMFHTYVVYYEEPSLKKIFGESYDEYLKITPRWIPRRPKKRSETSSSQNQ